MMKQKGFTLIELLVVIAIIGLLSTLAVVSLNSARAKARDARRTSDIRQVQTALEMYFNDQGAYPSRATSALNLGEGTALTLSSGIAGGAGFAAAVIGTTYMNQVPSDPQTSSYHYAYQVNNTTTSTYEIRFNLESANSSWGTGTFCKASSGAITCAATF